MNRGFDPWSNEEIVRLGKENTELKKLLNELLVATRAILPAALAHLEMLRAEGTWLDAKIQTFPVW